MRWFLIAMLLVGGSVGLSACSTPARTVAAAQTEFNDSSLTVNQSTLPDIERLLGSPSSIKKEPDGNKTYVYVKTRSELGFLFMPNGKGTTYTAEYTFNSNGILKEKNYNATPF